MRIIATASVVGFHRWEDAPPDVGYLARNHRHVFTFRAELRVGNSDRAAEFHQVQRWLRSVIPTLAREPSVECNEMNFGGQSCEMLAERLGLLLSRAGYAPHAVEVWEDNENAGRVEFA